MRSGTGIPPVRLRWRSGFVEDARPSLVAARRRGCVRPATSLRPIEPRPIFDSLRAVGRDLGLPDPGIVERITREWGTVAGRLAPVSRPLGVRDGRLLVAAADSAVAEALDWQSGDICRRLATQLDTDVVTRLDVRVRPRPGQAEEA